MNNNDNIRTDDLNQTAGSRNLDPLTGEPGAHPVGTGVGAAGGGTTGAMIGAAVGGPVGAVIGAAIGAVSGGLAGKGVAETLDPTVEDAYWKDNYATRDYVEPGTSYNDYQSAYKTGYESYGQYHGQNKKFEDVEDNLRDSWEKTKTNTKIGWEKAKYAAKDAWHKVERALPGDADGDGR